MPHTKDSIDHGQDGSGELQLAGLDDACDPALGDILALWRSLAGDGKPPLRQALDPFTLKPWLGHISIFEAVDGGDFMIRLEGSAIVQMTGENWTGQKASEVDRKYGSHLVPHMTEALAAKQPTFHRMMIFQRRHFFASRALLPVRKSADGPVDQIFLVMYRDVIQPEG